MSNGNRFSMKHYLRVPGRGAVPYRLRIEALSVSFAVDWCVPRVPDQQENWQTAHSRRLDQVDIERFSYARRLRI